VVKLPAREVYEMIAEDKIRDGKTIAALTLAATHIAALE